MPEVTSIEAIRDQAAEEIRKRTEWALSDVHRAVAEAHRAEAMRELLPASLFSIAERVLVEDFEQRHTHQPENARYSCHANMFMERIDFGDQRGLPPGKYRAVLLLLKIGEKSDVP